MENIIRRTSKILSFFSTRDDAKLATIGDVNQVVDKFNNIFPYRMFDIDISQVDEFAPTFRRLAVGASECNSNCASSGGVCACDCIKGCSNESGRFTVSFTYVSPGTYDMTITINSVYYPKPIKNIGIFLGTLTDDIKPRFEELPSEPTNVAIYRLTVRNSSNVLANNLLNNIVLAMKVYF